MLFWARALPSPRRGLAVASLALVLLIAGILTLVPTTRTTIADRLGIPGINISSDDAPNVPAGSALLLGDLTTLPDAVERAGFSPLSPPVALGDPDEVFIDTSTGHARVAYVYAPRDDLAEVGETGVGLLVMQFEGRTNESFIQKRLEDLNALTRDD